MPTLTAPAAAAPKHTPGPFSADKDGVRDASGKLIASVWFPRNVDQAQQPGESWLDMMDRTDGERLAVRAEMLANAALFASAPCLLAALKALHAILDGSILADDDLEVLDGLEAARAAIAKALGA